VTSGDNVRDVERLPAVPLSSNHGLRVAMALRLAERDSRLNGDNSKADVVVASLGLNISLTD
jgi:hypothetical protein